MDCYDLVWIAMIRYGFVWRCMDCYDLVWISME